MNLRTIRKSIATVSTLALLFTSIVTPFANTAKAASDVPSTAWSYKYLTALENAGVLKAEDKAMPGEYGTRGYGTMLLVLAAGVDLDAPDGGFSDTAGNQYKQYIDAAKAAGIVQGYEDGTFKPDAKINRAEWTKIITYGLVVDESSEDGYHTDVPKDAWFYGPVRDAYWMSIIDGVNNGSLFKPADFITRDAMWKTVVLGVNTTFQPTPRDPVTTKNFYDANTVTDEQIVALFSEGTTIEVVVDEEPTTTTAEGETTAEVLPVGGALGVAISSDTPAADNIPAGASAVELARFKFTAGEDDVTVSELNVIRLGLAATANFGKVYLYDNTGIRLTSGRNFSTIDGVTSVSFAALGHTIKAGQSKVYSVRVDFVRSTVATLSAGTVQLALMNANGVVSNSAEVTGSFPVAGNLFQTSTLDVGILRATNTGSNVSPNLGDADITLGQFQLATSGEAVNVSSIAFTVKGSIGKSALGNFKLVNNAGDVLATADSVSGDSVVLMKPETPIFMKDGANLTLQLRADLLSGAQATDTILTYIRYPSDISAVGTSYGYNVTVDVNAYDGGSVATAAPYTAAADLGNDPGSCTTPASDNCDGLTVTGGELNISFVGPLSTNIAPDSKGVEVLHVRVNAAQAGTAITRFGITVNATSGVLYGATTYLYNIKVVDGDGNTVFAPMTLSTAGSTTNQDVDFEDTKTFAAGETIDLYVLVDVRSTTPATYAYRVDFNKDKLTVEDPNGDTLSNIVPSSDLTGNSMTVITSTLSVSRASSPASKSYVKGTQNAPALGVSMTASNAVDVLVSSLSLQGFVNARSGVNAAFNNFIAPQTAATAGSDADSTSGTPAAADTVYFKDVVTSVKVYKDSVAPANLLKTKNATTLGLVVFDGLNLTVAKGSTVSLIFAVDLSNSDTYATYVSQVGLDFAISTGLVITAEGKDDASTVTISPATGINGTTASTNQTPTVALTVNRGAVLTVDIPNTTPLPTVVTSGEVETEVARIKFSATNENVKVTKFNLQNTAGQANNLKAVQVQYFTDAAFSVSEKKSCVLTSTDLWKCDSLNVYVPNPDDPGVAYTEVKVLATWDTIDTPDAAGVRMDSQDLTAVTFSLQGATDSFEAVGASVIRRTALVVDDITGTTGLAAFANGSDYNALSLTTFAASATTIVVDMGAANAPVTALTAGTIICNALANAVCAAGEEIMLFQSAAVCTGLDAPATGCTAANFANEAAWTVVRGMSGTTANTITNNDNIVVLPAASLLVTNTYESRRTSLGVVVSSSAQNPYAASKGGSSNPDETFWTGTVTAKSSGNVRVRGGALTGAFAEGTDLGNISTITSPTDDTIDGTASLSTISAAIPALNTLVATTGAGVIAAHTHFGVYVKWNDITAGTQNMTLVTDANLTNDDFLIFRGNVAASTVALGTASVGEFDNRAADTAGGTTTTIPDASWIFLKGPLPTDADATDDTVVGIQFTTQGGAKTAVANAADTFGLDGGTLFFNEYLQFTASASLAWNAATTTANATRALLNLDVNSQPKASAYLYAAATTAGSTAFVNFIPIGAANDIILSAGVPTTVLVRGNTAQVMSSLSNQPTLSFSLAMGARNGAGTVTPSGLYVNTGSSGNGDAPGITASSLNYYGTNASLRATVTSTY